MSTNSTDTSAWSLIPNLLYTLLMLAIFFPVISLMVSRPVVVVRRILAIRSLEKKFKCRVITLIHRQESAGLFGFAVAKYISIEDMESILQAIYLTSKSVPIWLILHTPGGLVISSEQIARALNNHKAGCTVFVPHYAMSGGTLIGIGSRQIVMAPNAMLGPVDPQIGTGFLGMFPLPAASILKALDSPNPHREDQYLALGDVAQKAITQLKGTVAELLSGKVAAGKEFEIAEMLTTGKWGLHDKPITFERAKELGLNVSSAFPIEIMRLMKLYKHAPSSAEYVKEAYL